jgi:hypothetical protein
VTPAAFRYDLVPAGCEVRMKYPKAVPTHQGLVEAMEDVVARLKSNPKPIGRGKAIRPSVVDETSKDDTNNTGATCTRRSVILTDVARDVTIEHVSTSRTLTNGRRYNIDSPKMLIRTISGLGMITIMFPPGADGRLGFPSRSAIDIIHACEVATEVVRRSMADERSDEPERFARAVAAMPDPDDRRTGVLTATPWTATSIRLSSGRRPAPDAATAATRRAVALLSPQVLVVDCNDHPTGEILMTRHSETFPEQYDDMDRLRAISWLQERAEAMGVVIP